MPDDRRNPYRQFTPELIGDYLRTRKVMSAELFSLGKNNTNYKLKLSDGDVCVLRLYANSRARREVYLVEFAAGLVPVPEELYRGTDWAIFSFIEGQCLAELPEYTGIAAEMINRLSSRTFRSAGDINPDGTVSAFPFGGIGDYIYQQLTTMTVQDWLGEKRTEEVFEIVAKNAPLYRELESHACLVHGDFNPTNILIKNNQVSGILDWEYCHSGTPYMDLGNLLRHTPRKYHHDIELALVVSNNGLVEDWVRRSRMIDLTSQLEFLTSSRSDDFKCQCVGRINRFINDFSIVR